MRIDYVKLLIRFPNGVRAMPEVQSMLGGIEKGILTAEERTQDKYKSNFKKATDYSQRETTGYIFEVYGPVADEFIKTNASSLQKDWISRLDYRIALHQDFNIRSIEDRAKNVGRRNFQSFNGKPKSKLGDRDSGGIGLAKGSHKSRRRITVYKRGQEQPAIELQLRQASAQDVFLTALTAAKAHSYYKDASNIARSELIHSYLIDAMYHEMNEDTQQELDLNLNWLVNLRDADILDDQEEMLIKMEELWEKLGNNAKSAFMQTIMQLGE